MYLLEVTIRNIHQLKKNKKNCLSCNKEILVRLGENLNYTGASKGRARHYYCNNCIDKEKYYGHNEKEHIWLEEQSDINLLLAYKDIGTERVRAKLHRLGYINKLGILSDKALNIITKNQT